VYLVSHLQSSSLTSPNKLDAIVGIMLRHLLTILASLSVCTAANLTSQIELIRNPPHHANYSPPYTPSPSYDPARLLIIGDVHGMLNQLEALLDKADYSSSRGDRVIFVGDLVNKGPKSSGVVQYAMDINATSVRGNHEDKVLRVWAGAEEARIKAEAEGKDGKEAYEAFKKNLGSGKQKALEVAESLTPEQRAWLSTLPVALRLGDLPGLGDVAVVHGGMVPGISLDEQEPWAMYNIRALIDFDDDDDEVVQSDEFKATIEERLADMAPGMEPSQQQLNNAKQRAIDLYRKVGHIPTSEFEDGNWWVEMWNQQQEEKVESDRMTVVYGHDSKRKIQMKGYSIGLDSGCVNGKKMTALVLQPKNGGGALRAMTLEHHLVSVSCPDKK
jgi:bis(5'-nucleosyl)-tetraphosphatase (symmetrical)